MRPFHAADILMLSSRVEASAVVTAQPLATIPESQHMSCRITLIAFGFVTLLEFVPLGIRARKPCEVGRQDRLSGRLSITQGGADHPAGYVRRVESGLLANGIKITVIGAGISGHSRVEPDARTA